jgi:hypothetical protein
MKTPSQFWTLFRFHAFASPWIWVMPLALGFQGFIGMNRFYGDLDSALIFFNQLSWIPLILAAMVFLPEFFLGGAWTTAQTQQQVQTFGADFMLTRAVDRSCVFRTRGTLFWCIIGLAVVSWIIAAAFHPGFTLELSSRSGAVQNADYYLKHLPGSFIEKTAQNGDVTIKAPMGNLQLKALMGAVTLAVSALWLVVLPLISRLPQRRWIYWGVFIAGVAIMPFFSIALRSPLEPAAVLGLANLPIVIVAALVATVFGQFLAERLLRSVEFM